MKDEPKKHIELIQIVIALIIAFVAGFTMLGKIARPAILLAVIAASVGAGVNIGIFFEKRRASKNTNIYS